MTHRSNLRSSYENSRDDFIQRHHSFTQQQSQERPYKNQNTHKSVNKQSKQQMLTDFEDNSSELEEQRLSQNLLTHNSTNNSNYQHSFYQEEQNQNFNVNSNSELYVWGRNQMGQLGMDPNVKSVVKLPQLIKFEHFSVRQISCGKAHTAFVTEVGTIYTMGSNKTGQLGVGSKDVQSLIQPEIVEALSMWTVKKVCCSKNSTFTVMESGELFSWGSNKEGVLGLGEEIQNQYFPIKVILDDTNNDQIEVLDISACKNHSGVICRQKTTKYNEQNCIYMWGSNKYGQLGLCDQEQRSFPTYIEIDFEPINISCGQTFTLIQSSNHQLYATGSNLQGQLGLGKQVNKQSSFTLVNGLPKQEIQKILSSDFCACLMRNGQLYIWGPTPIGQFNSPQLFQDLIQNDMSVNEKRNTSEFNNNYSNTYNAKSSATFISKIEPQKDNNLSPLRMMDIQTNGYSSRYSVQNQDLVNHNSQTVHHQQMIKKEIKHRDSCTPVRDYTPPVRIQMVQTPSQLNTPNTVRLRIQNQNTTYHNQHGFSYQTENDILNQTISNTPLRRTYGAMPTGQQYQPSQLNTPYSQQQQQQHNCHCTQHSNFVNQSNAMQVFPISSAMDQQFSSQLSFTGGQPMQSIEFIIKEKQELHQQINLEIQRRLLMEKELSDLYRQLEQMRNMHNPEIQRIVESQKQENQNLVEQYEILQIENEKMNQRIQQVESENYQIKKEYEDFIQRLQKENEYLKGKIELNQMSVGGCHSSNQNGDKSRELEEAIQKKNKEIYDLTVQLGCLKEENHQLKRDQDDMTDDFKERLRHQQIRAEADYLQLQQENNDILIQLSNFKEIAEELNSLRQLQEQKNTHILDLQNSNELLNAKIEEYEETIKIQRREIQIFSDQLKKQKQQQQQQYSQNKRLKIMESHSEILDIEDLKRAANDILGTSSKCSGDLQANIENQKPYSEAAFEKSQRQFNPIETPLESENKEILFQKFKQPINSKGSNKETGCLQVTSVQPQRRKSTQNNYNAQSRALKQSTNKSLLSSSILSQKQKTPNRFTSKHELALNHQKNSVLISSSTYISKSPISITKKKQQIIDKMQSSLDTNGDNGDDHNTTMQNLESNNPITTIHSKSIGKNNNRSTFVTNQPDDENAIIAHTPKTSQSPYSALGLQKSSQQSQSSTNLSKVGNLIEMKHKLHDIQNNKQYLEKKIYEYEKKLNELKGFEPNHQTRHPLQTNKLNTLSHALLEKVINDVRK